jgi:hypothetical protein
VLICAIWAGVHSLLASKTAKELAVRVAGARSRDGLYRLAYNAQSVLSVAWAARWFLRLPDRELYRARFPWSLLFRIGQAASLGVLFSGVRVVGVLEFAGLAPLWRLLTGHESRPEPEAQGPPSAMTRWSRRGRFALPGIPATWGRLACFCCGLA